MGSGITPQAAAAEIDKAARKVRRRARWQGWLPQRFTGWLVLLAAFMVTPLLAGAWRWLRS